MATPWRWSGRPAAARVRESVRERRLWCLGGVRRARRPPGPDRRRSATRSPARPAWCWSAASSGSATPRCSPRRLQGVTRTCVLSRTPLERDALEHQDPAAGPLRGCPLSPSAAAQQGDPDRRVEGAHTCRKRGPRAAAANGPPSRPRSPERSLALASPAVGTARQGAGSDNCAPVIRVSCRWPRRAPSGRGAAGGGRPPTHGRPPRSLPHWAVRHRRASDSDSKPRNARRRPRRSTRCG